MSCINVADVLATDDVKATGVVSGDVGQNL